MPEDAFHQRLKRRRGKASAHPCIQCGGDAFEWAYQHGGQDPIDFDSYAPMCRSCHRKLDLRESPALQESWAKIKDRGFTSEERARGGRNTPHPGRELTHEEAVRMGRKGGLTKAMNRKKG